METRKVLNISLTMPAIHVGAYGTTVKLFFPGGPVLVLKIRKTSAMLSDFNVMLDCVICFHRLCSVVRDK